jgi:hypothetical protein
MFLRVWRETYAKHTFAWTLVVTQYIASNESKQVEEQDKEIYNKFFPMISNCCHNPILHVTAPKSQKTWLLSALLVDTWHDGFQYHVQDFWSLLTMAPPKKVFKSFTESSRYWQTPRVTSLEVPPQEKPSMSCRPANGDKPVPSLPEPTPTSLTVVGYTCHNLPNTRRNNPCRSVGEADAGGQPGKLLLALRICFSSRGPTKP